MDLRRVNGFKVHLEGGKNTCISAFFDFTHIPVTRQTQPTLLATIEIQAARCHPPGRMLPMLMYYETTSIPGAFLDSLRAVDHTASAEVWAAR